MRHYFTGTFYFVEDFRNSSRAAATCHTHSEIYHLGHCQEFLSSMTTKIVVVSRETKELVIKIELKQLPKHYRLRNESVQ